MDIYLAIILTRD